MTYTSSDDSDRPAYSRSRIGVIAVVRPEIHVAKD